jgi:hypothetical protein
MASVVRSTALRAGGACVRCRKGKTKCVYENGRSPCKNCAKGMHECYLPSESMSHGGHGVSPARVQQRARESLPSERTVSSTSGDRQAPPPSSVSRHVSTTTEKYVPFSFPVFPTFARIAQLFSCVGAWFPVPTLIFPPRFPVAPLPAPFSFRARAPSTRRVPQFLALAPAGQAVPIFPTRTSFPKPARAIFLCSVHNFPSHPDCLGLGTQPHSLGIFTNPSWRFLSDGLCHMRTLTRAC